MRVGRFLGIAAVGIMVAAGVGARWAWTRVHQPYRGFPAEEQFVTIPPGSGASDIGRRLVESGVVRDDLTMRLALWWSGKATALKAGEYRFDAPATPFEVIDRLAGGGVYLARLTFPEGLAITEMAALFAAKGFGTEDAFLEAAGQADLVRDLDPEASDLEGYLFPETYGLPRGTSAADLVRLMVARFRASFSAGQQAAAARQGLTVRQVVTLASLVEKETARADERPLVAAVYRNRMRIGMLMQADPTVVYALRRLGRYDGNIRRADLQIDSRYNTYRYPGLPPGPIAAPGQASLAAVVEPADVRYLYFVSRNDGSHAFAESLRAHNANVQEYQVRYFRERRARRTPAPRGVR